MKSCSHLGKFSLCFAVWARVEMSVRAATAPLDGTVPGGNSPPSAAPAERGRRRAPRFLFGLYKIKRPGVNSEEFNSVIS